MLQLHTLQLAVKIDLKSIQVSVLLVRVLYELNQWNNIVLHKPNMTLFCRNFVFAVRTKIFV